MISEFDLRRRIRRIGLWATARWACKRGIPIELMLAAVRQTH